MQVLSGFWLIAGLGQTGAGSVVVLGSGDSQESLDWKLVFLISFTPILW